MEHHTWPEDVKSARLKEMVVADTVAKLKMLLRTFRDLIRWRVVTPLTVIFHKPIMAMEIDDWTAWLEADILLCKL